MFFSRSLAALVAAGGFIAPALAQAGDTTVYTDPDTGIVFDTWSVEASSSSAGFTFGVALPEDALTTDATEFIGYLKCASSATTSMTGWCGLSFGGSMNSDLLLVAYAEDDQILTSFRFSSGYAMPEVYAGDATLTQISSTISDDEFELLFHCKNCLAWDHEGVTGNATTSTGQLILAWAQGSESPTDASCPDELSLVQHEAQGIWVGKLDEKAASAKYESWVDLATETVDGTCSGSGGGNGTDTNTGVPVPSNATYEYIIVGSGPAGMVLADRISATGAKTLLIEKGPPSIGLWGGDIKPDWLNGTDLTRFDVPGLCNQIWVDSAGIACPDNDQMAGCVVGGGTAVNSGLWWKPYSKDFDEGFPEGWKYNDVAPSVQKVFERIPGTITPSMDNKLYLAEGPSVIMNGLTANGWKMSSFNDAPEEKYKSVGYSPYMFSNGQRNGPMATYLVDANERNNFDMWVNTNVRRVIREGGLVTGVEVEPFNEGGYQGSLNLTAGGKVILSAGAFGTPKILFRSGIGPEEQLSIVNGSSTDGDSMISESEWINLPVGENLMDHPNTEMVIHHPDIVFYDFYAAYDDPVAEDKQSYLTNRTGPLAQAAPNVNPVFFDQVTGPDGITRQLQYQARVEGSNGVADGHTMSITQYVGRGQTSRGKLTINSALNTVVSTLPWLQDDNDTSAVIAGFERLHESLSHIQGLTFAYPTPNVTIENFVNGLPKTGRGSNHWMGSCKMGTDDGRDGGDSVVDTDTKVYGMENLFVVDASIFPGMISTNPSAYIATVAESAVEKILRN